MINSIEVETTVFVEMVLECNECGGALSGEQRNTKADPITLYVEPCTDCLTAELEKGIEEGEGHAE